MKNRSLVVVLPDLTESHKAAICGAADSHGFDCRFFDEPSQTLPFLQDAEIIVGTDPFLSRNAPNLRWLCSPFAGVDPFLADDAFAAPSAPTAPAAPAAPPAPKVTVADIPQTAQQPQAGRVPQTNPFFKPQA